MREEKCEKLGVNIRQHRTMRGSARGAYMVGSACKQEIRLSLSVCLARSG